MELDIEILEAIKKIIAAKGEHTVSYTVNSENVKDTPFSKGLKKIIAINIKLEKPI